MNDRTEQPGKVKSTIYALQPIILSSQERDKLYGSILDSSVLGTEYLTMLALAGLLALGMTAWDITFADPNSGDAVHLS